MLASAAAAACARCRVVVVVCNVPRLLELGCIGAALVGSLPPRLTVCSSPGVSSASAVGVSTSKWTSACSALDNACGAGQAMSVAGGEPTDLQ